MPDRFAAYAGESVLAARSKARPNWAAADQLASAIDVSASSRNALSQNLDRLATGRSTARRYRVAEIVGNRTRITAGDARFALASWSSASQVLAPAPTTT